MTRRCSSEQIHLTLVIDVLELASIIVFLMGPVKRDPRVRFGKVHLYNNYTRNWGIYAVCASVESQVYSQCNIYEAGQKKKTFEFYVEKAADKEEARSGFIRSEGDLFLNGAQSYVTAAGGEECVSMQANFTPHGHWNPPQIP